MGGGILWAGEAGAFQRPEGRCHITLQRNRNRWESPVLGRERGDSKGYKSHLKMHMELHLEGLFVIPNGRLRATGWKVQGTDVSVTQERPGSVWTCQKRKCVSLKVTWALAEAEPEKGNHLAQSCPEVGCIKIRLQETWLLKYLPGLELYTQGTEKCSLQPPLPSQSWVAGSEAK